MSEAKYISKRALAVDASGIRKVFDLAAKMKDPINLSIGLPDFDVPDIVVNIQSADSTPAYLKLAVSLELDGPEARAAIEPVMPRVVDQFQTYLRELRVDDVRGSMGVMRLKEELLRRVNLAAAPTPVRDVLLKEMIVQ